nr:reverse transcriptase domain-containing protein [Tanacetum cinerariifolium]
MREYIRNVVKESRLVEKVKGEKIDLVIGSNGSIRMIKKANFMRWNKGLVNEIGLFEGVRRAWKFKFIVERPEEGSLNTLMEEEVELPEPWILFTDGSSCTDGSGAGLILTNPEGMDFTYALRLRFDVTNNKAEYEALITGLRIAEQIGVKNFQANVDSRLVANQVNRTYVAKEADMICYLEKVKALVGSFKAFSIKQIPRSENKKADALSKIASTSFAHLTDVKKARAIKRKSWRFAVVNETLYKKSFLGPWLRCVGPPQANYVLREIHKGSCSMHAGIGKVKFLIVAMYYFTKWIEAKPIATITGNQIKKFVWDNVVCRFGIPGEIISDNRKQFRDDPFKDWCEKLCIRQHFASVKHPQTNGLVERANRNLEEGIKAMLDARSKNWIEELPHVLWAYRTMIKSSNRDTPFSLAYETKVVIPIEIGMPTLRTAEVDLVGNNEALEINLDLLEERREETAIREDKTKAKMEKYYNSKVRNTSFNPGDLVYHNNDASRAEDTGKLGLKWEGPYEVTEALGKGVYKLRGRDGKQLSRT